MSPNKNYYPHLDGMRAVAALYVVFTHILTQFKFQGIYETSLIKKYSVLFFSNGILSVDFFIVISGFCLAIPMVNSNSFNIKGGVLSFYKKRFKRIYLPYLLAMLFSLVLIYTFVGQKTGTHWDLSLQITKADLYRHILLVHDVFYSSYAKINHAFWSISVECRMYLFFPLMLLIWRRLGPVATLMVAIGISIVLFIITLVFNNYNSDITTKIEGVNPYLILFVLGMIGSEIALSSKQQFVSLRNRLPWGIMILMFGITIFALQRISLHNNFGYWFEVIDVLVGCLALCVLVAVSEGRYYLDKLFSWRPLVFLGSFAYSIYLIHAPLIQIVWQYAVNPMHFDDYKAYGLLVLLGIPFIVMSSYLFYRIFERPFMNHKKSLLINEDLQRVEVPL